MTPNNAMGVAKMWYSDGETRISASFSNLTTPLWDDFYEGWLVRRSPFKMVSAWKLLNNNGEYSNFVSANESFTSYTHYVVTIEPNDGDNSPAEHILEWKVTVVDIAEVIENDETTDVAIPNNSIPNTSVITELSDTQKRLAIKIEAKLAGVSILQKKDLLERIINFQKQLPGLDISQAKKEEYAEILRVLVYVLSRK